MAPNSRDGKRFLPLRPLDFQVLTVLAHEAMHGYGIVQAARNQFPEQPGLEIGSLYRILSRMLDDELLEEVRPPAGRPQDRRNRRYYRATALGVSVIRAEARRMRALLDAPATARLLEGDA